MQSFILAHYKDVIVTYSLIHRSADTVKFSTATFARFKRGVQALSQVPCLTSSDLKWLSSTCPYLGDAYLDYISTFKFNLDQVKLSYDPKSEQIAVDIKGPWVETVLYEVPLMALLSEAYFEVQDIDWSDEGQEALAKEKGSQLLHAGVKFAEFGTRRRRSRKTQETVIRGLIDGAEKSLIGTSNVALALKLGLKPIGTIAHEMFMVMATLPSEFENYPDCVLSCQSKTLDLWNSHFRSKLNIALTDTFTTAQFWRDVDDDDRWKQWKAFRQDSGDPTEFLHDFSSQLIRRNLNRSEYSVVFSDGICVESAIQLQREAKLIDISCSFGIGTSITNDFRKISSTQQVSKALNIVIKVTSSNGRPCVKISDDKGKTSGDPDTVETIFNLITQKFVTG